MLKAYKYKINPSDNQIKKLNSFFGCSRFIYNWGLNRKSEYFAENKENKSCFTLIKEVTELKKQDEYSWLKDVHSQILQMSLRNLDNAYTNFFKKRSDFPKFKKKSNRQSFQYPQGVEIKNNKIFLPKIGWVNYFNSRNFSGDIKTVTVTKTPSGKYFVSILVDTKESKPIKKPILEETSVGLLIAIFPFITNSSFCISVTSTY